MKLFTKVKCKAYLKKISDGIFIQYFNEDGTINSDKYVKDYYTKAIARKLLDDGSCKNIADLSEFCGECVEKTYRERIETEFVGFVVGFTKIKTKGQIGTDWYSDIYGSSDYGYCWKTTTEYAKVGVVYFKNNVKRYVLLEDMEEI